MQEDSALPAEKTIIIDEPALRQGFTAVPNFLFSLKGLSHGARLTYVLLLRFAWQENSCFPGVETMAENLEVERKSVIRYTQELRKSGLITVTRRGLGKTNIYHLTRWSQFEQHARPTSRTAATPSSKSVITGSPTHRTCGSPSGRITRSPARRIGITRSRQEPSRRKLSVNADHDLGNKEATHIQYVVDEILKVCDDTASSSFYRQVASRVDDNVIFGWLAEIRQDPTIENRGAIFVSKLKAWRQKHAAPIASWHQS